MNGRMKRAILSYCLVVIFVFGLHNNVVNAYVKNGYVLSNPSNIKYKIGSVGPYASDTVTYLNKWQTYCTKIGFTSVATGENIYFYGNLTVDNGTYAVCNHNSNNYHAITYFKAFTTATSAERYETIVHEVGHALGLAHCQSDKENISVMRALGFNNKAYPLSDDTTGISAIY